MINFFICKQLIYFEMDAKILLTTLAICKICAMPFDSEKSHCAYACIDCKDKYKHKDRYIDGIHKEAKKITIPPLKEPPMLNTGEKTRTIVIPMCKPPTRKEKIFLYFSKDYTTIPDS